MIKINNVNKIFIENLNIEFNDTGFVCFMGNDDTKKHFIFNLLAGLEVDCSGEIEIDGIKFDLNDHKLIDLYRDSFVSYITPDYNFFDKKTVYQNLVFSYQILGKKIDHNKIEELLKRFKLDDIKKEKLSNLSIDKIHKLAIVRALLKEPKIIIVTEMGKYLDFDINSVENYKLLKEVSKNTLVIVMSKDPVFNLTDRILSFNNDQIDDKIINETKEIELKQPLTLANNSISLVNLLKFVFKLFRYKCLKIILALLISMISVSLIVASFSCFNYDKYQSIIERLIKNEEYYIKVDGLKKIIKYDRGEQIHYHEYIHGDYIGPKYGLAYQAEIGYNSTTLGGAYDIYLEVQDFEAYGMELIHGRIPENHQEIILSEDNANETLVKLYGSNHVNYDLVDLIGKKFTYNLGLFHENEFEISICGIAKNNIKYHRNSEYFFNFVNFGFTKYHLDNNLNILYSNFSLLNDLKKIDRINESYFYKYSETNNFSDTVKIYTEIGETDPNNIVLNDNEIILNLYYYNYLFNTNFTYDNFNYEEIEFNKEISLEAEVKYNTFKKEVKIKGIIFDTIHPLEFNEYNELLDFGYSQESLGILLSDSLYQEFIQDFYRPLKVFIYIVDNQEIKTILKEKYLPDHLDHPTNETDYIHSFYNEEDVYAKDLKDSWIKLLIGGFVFLIFASYLLRKLIKENRNNNFYFLSSFGINKRNLIKVFITEFILYGIVIYVFALLNLWTIFNLLKYRSILDKYVEGLKVDLSNSLFLLCLVVIIIFINIVKDLIGIKKYPLYQFFRIK